MQDRTPTYVEKVCAYLTRDNGEVLVFRGPTHSGLQVPKGTVEANERPRAAVFREIVEESGVTVFDQVSHIATDVWNRRNQPPKRYVRHFYHVPVQESRDEWTHTVTGTGSEAGLQFEFCWVDPTTTAEFALALDDYLHTIPCSPTSGASGHAPVE